MKDQSVEELLALSHRPAIRGQGFRNSRPIVLSTYRIQEWDGTCENVVVVSRDESPLGHVAIKYVRDGLVHQVSEEYFVHRLAPTNITTTRNVHGELTSYHDSDGVEQYC